MSDRPRPFWMGRTFLLFLAFICLEVFVTAPIRFIPQYLEARQYSLTEISNIAAATSIGAVLALPVMGPLVKRAARLTMFGGAIVEGLVLLGWALDLPGWGMIALNVCGGLASSLVFAAVFTVSVTSTPKEHRGQGIALFWAFVNLSRNVLGPAVAEPLIDGAWGFDFRSTTAAFGVLAIAGASMRVFMKYEEAPQTPDSGGRFVFLKELKKPAVLRFSGVFLIISFLFFAQSGLLTAFKVDRGFSEVRPHLYAYGALIVASRVLFGKLPDRLGHFWISVPSAALLVVFFLGMAYAESDLVFWSLGLVAGAANCLMWPAMYAVSYQRIETAAYATALTSFLLYAGTWLGGVTLGPLGDAVGFGGMFLVAAAVSGLLTLFMTGGAVREARERRVRAEAAA